jgi:LPXTG-site transpeptidase (sortase) family protein
MNIKNQLFLTRRALYASMLLILFLSTFLNGEVSSVLAQTGTTTHTITYFQGNKPGAVSFTFDDGLLTQATTGASELNARGLKGTFFVITSRGEVPWATWRSLAAQGHEIASHTVSHQSLPGQSVSDITRELSESQSIINQNVYNQSCITIAYPLTETNSTVQAIAANYYVAARGGWMAGYPNYYQPGQDQYGSWNTVDFTNVGSMLGDYLDINTNNQELQWFNRALDNAANRHAWYDIHFHEINDAAVFGNILDYVQGRDLYWIDTFGNIARYMRERLNSTVQVVAETNAEIRLQIVMDASLPTSLYNVPLTIRSTVPSSWGQVIVQQGTNTQTFTPVVEGSEKVVYYNALPNGGDVLLLDTPYPVPGITSLDPASAFAGGSAFTLTVNGNNFVTGSVVRWNNSNRATTYVSSTQLRVSIPASDIASIGTSYVRVFNPSPGGGTSGQLPFTITQPPPPGAFTKSGPGDGATEQSASPTLSWSTSTNATSYEYCYDTTDNNSCSSWTSNGASTNVALSGLSAATTYYWQVRAVNAFGMTYANGSTNAFWSFMVDSIPPTISSIDRANADPTNLAQVDFAVTFSESVMGGESANFTLIPGGDVNGASITSVSTGPGTTRIVTVDTGTGDGTLGLNMISVTGVTDLAGNALIGLPFTGQVYTIDKTAPTVAINNSPANPTTSQVATFTFATSGDPTMIECSLDGSVYAACDTATSQSYAGLLTEGFHDFNVRVTDAAGNINIGSYNWLIDITPPDTVITGNPADPDNDPNPAFEFMGNDISGIADFECQLDGGGFSLCGTGNKIGPLTDGPHTFDVRAIDNTGHTDPTPASYSWTVDATGPFVSIGIPSVVLTSSDPVDFGVTITDADTMNLQDKDVILNKSGTADATTIIITNGSTANPTITISGVTGDGTIGISILAGVATDTLGNPNLETSSVTFVVDNTAPQIAVDGIGSNAGIIGFDFQVITANVSQFNIKFSEDAYDPPGDTDPKDVTNPANYLLVRDLGTVSDFQTAGCASPGAVEPDDTKITIDGPITYDSNSFTATFTVNDDLPLSNGYYRLYICGSTSIIDHVGMHLAGNGAAGTDFLRSFIVNVPDGGGVNGGGDNDNDQTGANLRPVAGLIPTTGFTPNRVTNLPKQPAGLAYTSTGEMKLEIPSLSINIPIVGVKQVSAGWDLTWLGNNAGYLDGTAYPTWAGNTVLTAHVVDATNTPGPFAYLKELKDGDRVYIHANGFRYIYQVEKNTVVSLYNASAVFEHEEYDWLTLVTCENYSGLLKGYTSRRVVKAVLVSMIPER